jgi:Bacterial extracellular solute-binding protein
MNRTLLGLVIIGVVAAVSVAVTFLDLGGLFRQVQGRDPVSISILYGGEKEALLNNPAVAEIISGRYAITLQATRAGSIEMVTTMPVEGRDCLWPSNAVAVELARDSGKRVLSDETIFTSPIVFFAWAEIADALVAKGVVSLRNDGFLTADVAAIRDLIDQGARWKEDLGVNVYGSFKIFSTDPSRSNSGNIWAALLATALNNGETPVMADLPRLLPQITRYFAQMGYMESSSGDVFENFLKQGVGARPIIVGYENQLVEFLVANAQYADLIRDKIRVIYPEPTIFASHPLISLTPACNRLTEALLDPEVQAIAWASHGFRTGLIGVQNDPAAISAATLPDTISLVAPMPSAAVMEQLIEALN